MVKLTANLPAIRRAYNLAIQGGKLMHRPYIPMLKETNIRKGLL